MSKGDKLGNKSREAAWAGKKVVKWGRRQAMFKPMGNNWVGHNNVQRGIMGEWGVMSNNTMGLSQCWKGLPSFKNGYSLTPNCLGLGGE